MILITVLDCDIKAKTKQNKKKINSFETRYGRQYQK